MAARYSHYLLPDRGGRFPGRVLCLDVRGEAIPECSHMTGYRSALAGWAAVLLSRRHGAYLQVWESAGQTAGGFWDTLRQLLANRGTTWVVSPRACRAWSLLGLWERLESGVVTLRRPSADLRARTVSAGRASREGALVDSDPPSILRCWMPGLPGTLVWIDPRNWGAGCSDSASTPGLVARRCAGLVKSWCAALQSLSLGSLQATAGSQALHGWRAGHFWPGVWAHVHPGALALEEDGFHGGRAEVYSMGRCANRCWYLDIRSAYPWACATFNLPVRLGGYAEGDAARALVASRSVWDCLAEVTVRTEEPCYPVRRGPDTIYPVGRFRAVLPGPELMLAARRKHIVHVHRASWYDCAPALRDYAVAVHDARCEAEVEGNADLASCLKQMLVSLPGKLAQRSWRWQAMPNLPAPAPYATWWQPNREGKLVRYRSVAFAVQRCVPSGWAPDAIPAMAAWITSAVRVRLLEEIEKAGWDHVSYCDTDGFIVTEGGYRPPRYPHGHGPPQLGALTLRGVYDDLEIRGIKHYHAGGFTVCAGLPRGTPVVVEGKEHWWEDVGPTEQIRRRDRPEALRELRPFERGPAYRHGVVGPDGRVSPIRLEET